MRPDIDFEELLQYPLTYLDYSKSSYANINDIHYRFFMKFAHIVLDYDWRRCRHLDLAIRSYNNVNAFSDRISSKMTDFGRDQLYQKLLQINSLSKNYSIPYEHLIGRYFIYNPYILECFEGKINNQELVDKRRKLLVSSLKNSSLLMEYISDS